MNPERREAAVAMLNVLRDDIRADVTHRDGQPFTGTTIGVALGEMCAQIDALARTLIAILEEEA